MAKQNKQAKKPAPKKTIRKRPLPKKQNFKRKIFPLIVLMLLCFGAGVLTYKSLDALFSDKKVTDTKTKQQIPQPKEKTEEDLTIKFPEIPLLDEEKAEKTIDIIKIDEDNKTFLPPIVATPSGKPKLAIIIDDVATSTHAKNIKKIDLKLTPSIFPPNKNHPDTVQIAKSFEFYMIHLPTEALNFNSPEFDTLTTKDSYNTVEKRVKFIRDKFKDAKFINNHTGSKFTSDYDSMEKLLMALLRYDFIFIDSKTISDTKTQELAPKYGMRYVYRDIFLDNSDDIRQIKEQLKKAVNLAKDRGYAIAIGHPRRSTFMALNEAKDDILKSVDVVFLSEIYEYYK
ncbi:MAG: divergent polysaccharide deacetylase family protein [Campylobacter sp.]|nr:divergent polysaccharide deacetylase family protein [Campylobacter sp.]